MSEAKFANLQQDIIIDRVYGTVPSDSPTVIILGAQPGAGKSELAELAKQELGLNVVSCNVDDLRDLHPQIEEIKKFHEADYSEITNPCAHGWNKGLRSYCEANRLNFILETTFHAGPLMNEYIKSMLDKGYRVEIKHLAVHPSISLLGTHMRFEKMKKADGFGRAVSKEFHDERYFKQVPTLKAVSEAALYNKLQVYGRFYDRKGVALLGTNALNSVELYCYEVDKKWEPAIATFFEHNKNIVISLKEDRKAPDADIESFKNEMDFKYPTQKALALTNEQKSTSQA